MTKIKRFCYLCNTSELAMIDKLIKFVRSRAGLSILLALQIFIGKTARTRTHVLVACGLILVFGVIGIHTGMCPVKYTLTTLCAKLNLG